MSPLSRPTLNVSYTSIGAYGAQLLQHRTLPRQERIDERRGGDAILRVNICATAHLKGHAVELNQ